MFNIAEHIKVIVIGRDDTDLSHGPSAGKMNAVQFQRLSAPVQDEHVAPV